MYKSFLGLFVLILGLAVLLIIGLLSVAQEALTRDMLASCSTERLVEEHAFFCVIMRYADPVMPNPSPMPRQRDSRLKEGVNA